MQNILNIYKFSFPFIEYKYEKAKFLESISDVEHFLMYDWKYLKTHKKDWKWSFFRRIQFVWWSVDVTLKQYRNFYVPTYQFEVFFEDEIDKKVLKNIVKIFVTLGIKDYIFDYRKDLELELNHRDIITNKSLQKDFKKFNEKKMRNFLEWFNNTYAYEKLKGDREIQNSVTYMIYICFIFYKNHVHLKNELEELSSLESKNIHSAYKWIINVNIKRLELIDDIGIYNFKKYNKMLDRFFSLLS